LRNSVGIAENENGSFKTNVMRAKVLPVLVLIPFKSHSWVAAKTLYPTGLWMSIHLYIHDCVGENSRFHSTDPTNSKEGKSVTNRDGGEGGIRTHETVPGLPAFEAGSFNRSDTSPRGKA
jgi:hypothetical protein